MVHDTHIDVDNSLSKIPLCTNNDKNTTKNAGIVCTTAEPEKRKKSGIVRYIRPIGVSFQLYNHQTIEQLDKKS
jgi:hypothetical protein